MKSSIKNRLKKLEKKLGINRRHKTAFVVCDPKILHSLDTSEIDADYILILPDNGQRIQGQIVPQGSYLVSYPTITGSRDAAAGRS